MNFKYIRPLIVAAVIHIVLGMFLFICGVLEFTGIISTSANTIYRTIGVQLSQLVFISGLLLLLSGILTFTMRKTMAMIDLQIFIGVASLAWPIFVSIALFFSTFPHTINIRLIPSAFASLFYLVCILVVKMANESLRSVHRINTHIGQMGKRKQSIDVGAVLTATSEAQKHTGPSLNSLHGIAESFQMKNATAAGAKRLFSGGRRRAAFNPFRYFASNGSRRRVGGGLFKRLYSGSRRRRHR